MSAYLRWFVAVAALVAALLAVWRLEAAREGVQIIHGRLGETTPITLYQGSDAPAPVIVVAHGFAGSRQLMEAFSLTLARAGYHVLAFDFEGHGANPVPMSGDVDDIEGTTELLIAETLRVLDAGLTLPQSDGRAALLGHSMASDIVIRASLRAPEVEAVIAVSMFSQAVTAQAPERLLAITGAWEPGLRRFALDALREVDPMAEEGDTAVAGDVVRRAAVAPHLEHVGVLYSATSLTEARDWLDSAFGRTGGGPVTVIGPWILLLLAALLALFWPISGLLRRADAPPQPLSRGGFALAVLAPAAVAPLGAIRFELELIPVLVADYLMIHLALQGVLQLAILWRMGVRPGRPRPLGAVLLLVWGITVFGFALDRYGASFWPIPERFPVILALAAGAVPFMLADATLTLGTGAGSIRRAGARLAFLGSLAIAVALDTERLFFLVLILPVVVLFFVVFGLMGRWVGRRSGPATAGLALGLILAWSLGVSFPMFDAGP